MLLKKYQIFIFLLFFLVGGFFIFSPSARAEDLIISSDTVWDGDEVVTITQPDMLIINSGVTLTVMPGAIIKLFNSFIFIFENGSLIVQGSSVEPVIFTSFADDTVGGDSNGDGDSTAPAPGDWEGIMTNRSGVSVNIDYAEIRYGSGMIIYSSGGTVAVSHSSILNSTGQILIVSTASSQIEYTNIYNPDFCLDEDPWGIGLPVTFCGGPRVMSEVSNPIEAANNYWGHQNGPTNYNQSGNINDLVINGTCVNDGVIFEPFLSEPWTPEQQSTEPDPVIIVPGIMGSRLLERINYDDYNEIWPNIDRMLLPGEDSYLNDLVLNLDGTRPDDIDIVTGDIIRKILISDFFKGLIDELEDNGYQENENLFVFPYDWRLDITQSAETFKDFVENVRGITNTEKVNVIAHSMGGLVVKKYIHDFGDQYLNKFIDIATPHYGAPGAFKILQYGDDLGMKMFVFGINQYTIRNIAQNMPSVYQLLPSLNYFDYNGQDYNYYISDVFDMDNNQVKGNLSYLESIDFMKNIGSNSYLLDHSIGIHNEIDNIIVDNGYNIIGCGLPTVGKIYVLNKEKSGGWEYGLKYINGDGTVPFRSADGLSTQNKYYVNNISHANIPSAEGVRQIVKTLLKDDINNFQFSNYENISPDSSNCSFSGTQVSFHSPIELHIYDENNNHLGPDENGDIEMGIPGAQYDVLDDNKFAFLPKGHTYTIIGQATNAGSFNARIQNINDGQYGQTVYYNEIPLQTADSNIQFGISDGQENYIIQVDQNGDQIFESEVVPSSILTGGEANDLIKPITELVLTGEINSEGKYINEAVMELIAEDNENGSGILKTEYSLDSGQTWFQYKEAIIISEAGSFNILYASTDRAGNVEEAREISFDVKIIDIDSVISEIEAFFDQNLITKESVKNWLIQNLEWIDKYIKKYGQKQTKRNERFNKIIKKCEKIKSNEWCEQKLGNIFNNIIIKLDKANKKIIITKYETILKLLELYYKKQWLNNKAYSIIKEDIEYLINYLNN